MNILVVDDEPVIVKGIVKRIHNIKNFYAQATGAYSGEGALALIDEFVPDLTITDIQMPQMDGFTLISRIREKSLCKNYIILTAHEDFNYARLAVHYHALEYMVKPVDWDLLEEYIRECAAQPVKKANLDQILREFTMFGEDIPVESLSQPLRKIVSYIQSNYTKEITLTHLSIFSGISENYICNLFKKEFNQTFLDFVCTLRLRKAIELLCGGDGKNMRVISSMLGYRSERQFYRLFKNKLGVTPQQFRETYLM
ncbi:MAG: response regulator [Oscillospiraceae bacterium]|nr:response regulator [Oscillospiraceae bacterium]